MAFYGGPRGPPPPPWQVVVAPGQPRPYYFNPVTNVTTWEPLLYHLDADLKPLKDAKLRSEYEKTVKVEIGRMVDFGCWGRPVARQSIRNDAWVYRVNMLYGIKNVEIPEKSKDKARLVLMGNLRFTKSGKLLLDKWFRSPGEFWAPASSMAGLRMVAALAVILGLPIETIDLD